MQKHNKMVDGVNDKVFVEILVNRFDNDGNDLHFDVTASNLFADRYNEHTSKERFYLASKKKCDNSSKHEQVRHFIHLVVQVMDGISDELKHVLQKIAHK